MNIRVSELKIVILVILLTWNQVFGKPDDFCNVDSMSYEFVILWERYSNVKKGAKLKLVSNPPR